MKKTLERACRRLNSTLRKEGLPDDVPRPAEVQRRQGRFSDADVEP